MIKLYIKGHGAVTPLSEIIHAFTGDKIELTESADEADVISLLEDGIVSTCINGAWNKNPVMPSKIRNEKQRSGDAVKLGYYQLASSIYGKELPWGIITGIRPAKLAGEFSEAGSIDEFKKRFRVSDKKISLCEMTNKAQKSIRSKINDDIVSIYIGIPFCPSRCQYCSFVSLAMGKQMHLIEPYVDTLIKEMGYTARLIEKAGKKIGAVYIGGGTPTALDEKQFSKMVKAAGEYFGSEDLQEFTVEAGRADTITGGKLSAALDAGMTRLCINPQTMNNDVLAAIGRKHTAEDFESAYRMARSIGIKHINTDVIAGLPGETTEMFEKSLERLLMLAPDAVTVHTMCVKRAADLKTAEYVTYNAEKMVDFAFDTLVEKGYMPYYLYRQKDTLGGLENTGFALAGKESYYNILMMEDLGTVIGLGAGSATKIKTDGPNKFKKYYNFKNPTEYISGFDELIERKADYGL